MKAYIFFSSSLFFGGGVSGFCSGTGQGLEQLPCLEFRQQFLINHGDSSLLVVQMGQETQSVASVNTVK